MDTKRFTVTDEHLTLLRAMYVGWCDDEFGAPEIDPKRPYGNSDVMLDLAELIGSPDADRLRRLHAETETALQIVLATGTFAAGDYEASPYSIDWSLVEAS